MSEPQNPKWRVEVGADALVVFEDGSRAVIGDAIYHPENVERARLIAAAPELVAALEAANDLLKQEFGSMYDRFDPLLARVRGEEKQG